MIASLNPKLEGVFVNDVVMESEAKDETGWRVYSANTAQGQRPLFLYCAGTGRVNLGRTEVFWDKMLNPVAETALNWDDEQTAFNFAKTHFQLKRWYGAIAKNEDRDFSEFPDVFRNNGFIFYRAAPPVSEAELAKLDRADFERAIDEHVAGNFDLDPRIKAWGYGNLVRFPQHSQFVPWTKFRGHSLIVKSTKSGCSHIAHRTSPTYDQVSTKSFEGFADAEGNVMYSPLHQNFHACVLDEIDQLEEGVMTKLFAFMESGEYSTVKAAKRILNEGNSRLSFITNPKSMDETRGAVYAVNSVLDAYFDVLFKLTSGNFGAGMSRFGLVVVGNVKEANGKALPRKDQAYSDAVATSVFDVLAPKVAKLYDDESVAAWLSTPIEFYNDQVEKIVAEFDDYRLKVAWRGQQSAYRHVRGAALEIAIANQAFDLFHGKTPVCDLLDVADEILEDVVEWNMGSLRAIVDATKGEDTVEAIASRLGRAKPHYVRAVITAMAVSPSGQETDLELAYDRLPRSLRDHVDPQRFYCWTHVSERIRQDGASSRLKHGLALFGVDVNYGSVNGRFHFTTNTAQLAKLKQAVRIMLPEAVRPMFDTFQDYGTEKVGGIVLPDKKPTSVSDVNKNSLPTVKVEHCPQCPPNDKKILGTVQGQLADRQPPSTNCPQSVPEEIRRHGDSEDISRTARGLTNVDPNHSIIVKRVKFKEGGGSYTLEDPQTGV